MMIESVQVSAVAALPTMVASWFSLILISGLHLESVSNKELLLVAIKDTHVISKNLLTSLGPCKLTFLRLDFLLSFWLNIKKTKVFNDERFGVSYGFIILNQTKCLFMYCLVPDFLSLPFDFLNVYIFGKR